ncbi:mRNA-binding phosphate metabolism regulator [Saccharomycopsis crataegensis]|uniref:mRNA-binding phosphate metabolism regulator n=1 Tax=Saccharomycopsis crataegensis TaxID=43959 RepID=A0AAV5QHU7_9ASCO|nr:mRNA-binding phosphate metabolism regulator [Saccharomycopsis crataegensis]
MTAPDNTNPLLIYNSFMSITQNNNYNNEQKNSAPINSTLKRAVERQPLFQLLTLNQKTNDLIKNKTNFLTNSALSLTTKKGNTVNTTRQQHKSLNAFTGTGSPKYDRSQTTPIPESHESLSQSNYLSIGRNSLDGYNTNNNAVHPQDQQMQSPVFNSTVTRRNSEDIYLTKLDTNISHNPKKRHEFPTSPVEFANSIWSPNATTSPTGASFAGLSSSSTPHINSSFHETRLLGDSDYTDCGGVNRFGNESSRYSVNQYELPSSTSSYAPSSQESTFDQHSFTSTYSPISTSFEFARQENTHNYSFKQTTSDEYSHQPGIISPPNFNLHESSRFFNIKLSSVTELQNAFYSKFWSSNNQFINKKLLEVLSTNHPVYLLFSVHGYHSFSGIAQLLSGFQNNLSSDQILFNLQFTFVKEMSLNYFQSLAISAHQHQSVINCADGQEISVLTASTIVEIFKTVHSGQSFLTNN